ncbi:Tyrosine-protein phosphatase non-receptor type 7 [Varanus komodoensis]|nr:Tyrosine-protein phosphatase non-receptor type 7 [Varanus komodoensis]
MGLLTAQVRTIHCWHSMVQACSACSGVHSSTLLHQQMREGMDKDTYNSQEVKKHVRLQDRIKSAQDLRSGGETYCSVLALGKVQKAGFVPGDVPTLESPPPTDMLRANRNGVSAPRRGSNVSLVLDMSSLSNIEPIQSLSTPRDVTVQLLNTTSHVLTQKMLQRNWSLEDLQEEFAKVPSNFISPDELDIPGRAAKDRYKSILPSMFTLGFTADSRDVKMGKEDCLIYPFGDPQSRVHLKRAKSQEDERYINANYIRGYAGREKTYIATQGPMLNTVNDFWAMVWQEEAPLIVMLTKLKEEKEKCICYWPETETTYGPFTIQVQSICESEEYTTRSFTLQLKDECRTVKHIVFSSWPDQKTPESAKALLHLVLEVEKIIQTAESTGPIIVHCSAGIGRTGCFIATQIGCQQLKEKGEVDILGIVCQLRIDRCVSNDQ